MKRYGAWVLIFGFIFGLQMTSAWAQTPREKGLEIFKEADNRDFGFHDYICDMVMTLSNRHGQKSVRDLRIRVLEQEHDGDKNLAVFDSPRDIKGTIFLTHTHKRGDDAQWLYLPAVKRVKRISSKNKSGSFMGSEFAYEDIASQEIEKYTYKWIKDEPYDGQDCFVVERYPVDKENSGYIRQVVWMDKREYRILKIDYYDRKEFLLKTLSFNGYKKYLNKFWRASEMEMVNHQNGKSTYLLRSNYRFRNGLADSDFDRSVLRRGL
jgi:outer membrane lipoprotein-sorting protein